MIGAQASSEQMEKILCYIDIGKQEGAEVADRRQARAPGRRSEDGYYVSRPSSAATTRCASSRKRSSGRWFR